MEVASVCKFLNKTTWPYDILNASLGGYKHLKKLLDQSDGLTDVHFHP